VRLEPNWQDKEWDVVTFFDSLEHFVDLPKIHAKFVVVSVPWYDGMADEKWFAEWKHRRPGEHLWHFNSLSLSLVFQRMGMREVYCGNPEDEIRKGDGTRPNILTMVFAR